jgi:4-hydroxy-tetrahydrodipicolinate synthase
MKSLPWSGVYPAVTTKFTREGQLDLETFIHNIRAQISAGINGIIIGGSLGESSTITHDERIVMLAAVIDTFQRKVPVLN